MNLKKLNDSELLKLINTTNDPEILDEAETEYLNRMDVDTNLMEDFDELSDYEREFMKKHWRPS